MEQRGNIQVMKNGARMRFEIHSLDELTTLFS